MGLWTGNTEKQLYLFYVDGDVLALPCGTGKQVRRFLTEDTGIDLYIDHVSKLDFGQKSISLTDQDYKSTGHTFSVVDLTGIYSGWSLSVK